MHPCSGERSGVTYMNGDEGHFYSMAGQKGHTEICVDRQICGILKKKVPKKRASAARIESDDSGESTDEMTYGERSAIGVREEKMAVCRSRSSQDHGHSPPTLCEVQLMVFRWSCKIIAARYPKTLSAAAIITKVFEDWPFRVTLKLREYTALFVKYLEGFQKSSMEDTNTSAATLLENCGSVVLENFIALIMSAPPYWGEPELRGKCHPREELFLLILREKKKNFFICSVEMGAVWFTSRLLVK